MALTSIQRDVLRLLSENRRLVDGGYVAGGMALNNIAEAPRESRDMDVFYDRADSLKESFLLDCQTLCAAGYEISVIRREYNFVEVKLDKDGQSMKAQWCVDSAYRFFPLQANDVSGYTMHPLDLATNKLLALVGRTAVRDWIDTITAIQKVQPLPYLLSAACGKDPGYTPASLLELIARRRYNQVEIDDEILPRGSYDAAELCVFWHKVVAEAWASLELFPVEAVGKAFLSSDGTLFRGDNAEFKRALKEKTLVFHEGSLRGAVPKLI